MTTKKRAAISVSTVIGLYVLSYTALSPFGKYAVNDWYLLVRSGPSTPRWYQWAPPGFYDPATGEWRHFVINLYRPLWKVDNWYWHTRGWHPELTNSPRHPAILTAGVYKSIPL